MEIHELDIVIGPDGKMEVHVHGAKGPACMEYVKLLETVMGATGEVTQTSEYYEPETGVEVKLDQELKR